MREIFPTQLKHHRLTVGDFTIFSKSFGSILERLIPTSETVHFFSKEEIYTLSWDHLDCKDLEESLSQMKTSKQCYPGYFVADNYILLSFQIADLGQIFALVYGVDPVFAKRVREDWLAEIHEQAEREFLLLKQARIDCQTGLLNLINLHFLLEQIEDENIQLILIELPPHRSTYSYMQHHVQQCSKLLGNFFGNNNLLHYLGHATFAVLVSPASSEAAKVESRLVAYLKKEGCKKVHIGSSRPNRTHTGEKQKLKEEYLLLDEAWTALHHAQRRGVFSFCEYEKLAYPEKHPLAPPPQGLVRRLTAVWRDLECFTLIQFKSDEENEGIADKVLSYVDKGKTVVASEDLFVVLEEKIQEGSKLWTQAILRRLRDEAGVSVSAGISRYPYGDFRKVEMVQNCRKALLHAQFFGAESVVAFDQVSLNISGDIYFGEGNFTRAIKEYKRGVLCGPDVNLFNSLGVTYAMMGRLTQAIGSFQQALDIEEDNFMSLFNLGLARHAKGDLHGAWKNLDAAYDAGTNQEIAEDGVLELQLQLGLICSQIGLNQQAVLCLEKWLENNHPHPRVDTVYYSLGKAHHGLGHNNDAMAFLQKTIVLNETHAQAIGLLGKLYLIEKEGSDIALSLCQKSVELEPENHQTKLYLAEVYITQNNLPEARRVLQSCLRSRTYSNEARLLMGRGYEAEGKLKRAAVWYEKVLNKGGEDKEKKREARQRLSKCKALMRKKAR